MTFPIRLLAYSLACVAWACYGRRSYIAGSERTGHLIEESREGHPAEQSRSTALASLFFAQAPAWRKIPALRRESPTRYMHQRGDLITPSGRSMSPREPLLQDLIFPRQGMIAPRKLVLQRVAAARRGLPSMNSIYAIPPAEEQIWIEKNLPVQAERVLYLGGDVNDELVNRIIASMIYLDALEHKDIYLYINSPGGSVIAGMALYDCMQHVKSDVITINMGMAASTASLVLGAGVRGKRVGMSSSGVMIHQPASGGLTGDGKLDKRVDADQIKRIKDVIVSMYSDMTGHPRAKIIEDVSFDNYMTAQEALEYGLIDKIIENEPSWDLDP